MNYVLKPEYITIIPQLLKTMPLVLYFKDNTGLVVYSPTSSKYIVFEYYKTDNNSVSDYLCMGSNLWCGSVQGIEQCQYFSNDKLNDIIPHVSKCVTWTHDEGVDNHLDKFEKLSHCV